MYQTRAPSLSYSGCLITYYYYKVGSWFSRLCPLALSLTGQVAKYTGSQVIGRYTNYLRDFR